MNAILVLLREVRAETRRAFTYWLRVLGGGVALAAAVSVVADMTTTAPASGQRVFTAINTAVFGAIWTLVPLLTADCLSRERREGTLGLLLLTPLTAANVVVAKSLAQMLRAWSLMLAVVPVLALAFLLGGVGWFELLNATCLNLASVSLALSAGLLVSSRAKARHRAAAGAVILSLCVALIFAQGYTLALFLQVFRPLSPADPLPQWHEWMGAWLPALTGVGGAWTDSRNFLPATVPPYLGVSLQFLLLSQLVMAGAIRLAARQITRAKAEHSLPRPWLWLRKLFFEPLCFRRVLRERQRMRLSWNPIGWLQGRTTTARLTKWGWCLALVVIESAAMVTLHTVDFAGLQLILTFSLAVGMSLSAASSFREERDSGALELILVSPLTEAQIIRGRLRGLYAQFLPAVAALPLFVGFAFVAVSYLSMWPARTEAMLLQGVLILLASAWAFLPPVGLLYSVTQVNLGAAWGRTVGGGLLIPWFGGLGLALWLEFVYHSVGVTLWPWLTVYSVVAVRLAPWFIFAIQGLLALFAYRRLQCCLRERQFTRFRLPDELRPR
jgi:ABC-type transport system involved in multi-copper enzyme maturation permease subunit